MARLIDWDEVLKWMHRQKETTEQWSMRIAIENYVDEMPTIDAAPVRHGRWIDEGRYGVNFPHHVWQCSECGDQVTEIDTPWYRYCPNCGAKMDGKEDDKTN